MFSFSMCIFISLITAYVYLNMSNWRECIPLKMCVYASYECTHTMSISQTWLFVCTCPTHTCVSHPRPYSYSCHPSKHVLTCACLHHARQYWLTPDEKKEKRRVQDQIKRMTRKPSTNHKSFHGPHSEGNQSNNTKARTARHLEVLSRK